MTLPSRAVKFSKLNVSLGVMLGAFTLAWLNTMNGWVIALNCFLGMMVYMTLIRTLTIDDVKFVINGFLWLVLASIMVLGLQLTGWDPRGAVLINTNTPPPESLFFQRSAMGMFFANSIPLLATLNVYLAPVLLFPMLWSQSSGAYLGAGCGLLFFLWFRKRIMFWIILGVFTCVILISLTQPATISETMTGLKIRIPIWKSLTQSIFQKPIGHGLDSFASPKIDGQAIRYNYFVNGKHDVATFIKNGDALLPADNKSHEYLKEAIMLSNGRNIGVLTLMDHPHNEFLWLGYEVGLHALVILGFILYFIWKRFYLSKRSVITCASMAVIIAFVAESVFQFPLHLSRIGSLLPFIMAAFYISTEEA